MGGSRRKERQTKSARIRLHNNRQILCPPDRLLLIHESLVQLIKNTARIAWQLKTFFCDKRENSNSGRSGKGCHSACLCASKNSRSILYAAGNKISNNGKRQSRKKSGTAYGHSAVALKGNSHTGRHGRCSGYRPDARIFV